MKTVLPQSFVLLALFMAIGFSGQAQSGTGSEDVKLINFVEFTLDPVNPIYSFDERVGENLFGFSLSYLRQRKRSRLDYFGVQFSYYHIASLSQSFFSFEEKTGTNMLNLRMLYRYYPDFYFWRIEPFFEASLGPQAVYTVTTTSSFVDDTASINFEEFDMGLGYSVGLGLTTFITGQLFLLTKVNFNGGTSLTYYVPGEYIQGLPFDNFVSETSAINYISWQLGISVSF